MARKFVDLSIYLENDVLSDPPSLAPRIEIQIRGASAGWTRAVAIFDDALLRSGLQSEDRA